MPIHPPYAGRVAGPMTRDVVDAALLMSVLARPDLPDLRDSTALPDQAIDWSLAAQPLEVEGLRVGLWLDAGWGDAVEPQVRAAIVFAAQRFAAAGALVEALEPLCTRAMADGMDRFWRMRAWLDLQALPAARRARVLPYIVEWAAPAAGYSGAEVFSGHSQMAALRDAACAATRGFDIVLSPVAPMPAFAAEKASPRNDPRQPFEHIAFTLPFNMSEQPAIALPCATSGDGRPIGLQIAGPRHADLRLLRAARAILDPMLNLGLTDREQARKVLVEGVGLSEAMATQELDRYTVRAPGQACSYFYGYTRIMELRMRTELAQGDRFDRLAFNNFLLDQGLLPPDQLATAVDEVFIPAQRRR